MDSFVQSAKEIKDKSACLAAQTYEDVAHAAHGAHTVAIESRDRLQRLLSSSMIRCFLFLCVGMPVVFLLLMVCGAWMMSYITGWRYQRGYDFMASAITGGAIVFPADPPKSVKSKLFASIAGASGVGIFGFMVATLSNSVAVPVIKTLGLEGEGTTYRVVFGRLGLLALLVTVANLLFAMCFGAILAASQGWTFWTGFKTMASVELGGGIQFYGMGRVTTFEGSLLYCIVGIWSLGIASLMISIAGRPSTSIVQAKSGIQLGEEATVVQALSKLAFLVVFILPVTLLLVMLLVAVVMGTGLTTWDFVGSFWAALPAVSGGAAALSTGRNPPLTVFGAICLICAASVGFFFLSIMIGVGASLIAPIMELSFLGRQRGVCGAVAALALISYVIIPLLVLVLSALLGGLMAIMQGWSYMDGFWWVVGVQLGGGMALTTAEVTSLPGMLVGVFGVAWSIGISILSVGLSEAPAVVPLMDALGMTLDPEELKPLMEKSNTATRASMARMSIASQAKYSA